MSEGIILSLLVAGGVQAEVTNSLADTATKLTAADAATKALNRSWTETKAALDLASQAFRAVVGAVDEIAALSSEAAGLSANAQRLGLDFDHAADGAGRFVDETDAMAAASRLAEAGLRLTQDQLDQLTARAAIASQRLGVDTTTAFTMLTSAVESGSVRALRPFGEDMVRLAGDSHTAAERLAAFTESTRGMARATDDASTSMARWRDAVGDAQRTMASAFTTELAHLHQISEATNGVTADAEDTTHQLRALGSTAALMVTQVGNGIAVVVGTAIAGMLHMVGWARVQLAELNAIAHGSLPGSDAFARASAAARQEHLGTGSAANDAEGFVDRRIAALSALDNAAGPGNGGETRTAIGASAEAQARARAMSDAANAAGGAAQANATAIANRRGGSAGATRRETMAQLMGRAGGAEHLTFQGARGRLDVLGEADETANAAGKAGAQRSMDESVQTSRRAAEAQRQTQRRQDDQAAHERALSTRMNATLREYGDTAQHTRDLVVGSFEDMTAAIGTHIEALAKGRETAAEALQGMLSDTLGAISKRASVMAAEEFVSSIASLARGDLAGAGLHAAAGVGFAAVAGLAGAASSATAVTPSSASKGASESTRAAQPGGASRSREGGDVAPVSIYFGGPVIGAGGAREAARTIVGILNDGARQGGVSLSPSILPA